MSFKDLTDEQKRQYEEGLRKAGIDRASVPKSVVIEWEHHHHRDAGRANLKIHTVRVVDLQQLKDLVGVPDTRYTKEKQSDAFITYPKALAPERARLLPSVKDADSLYAVLMPQEREAIDDAMRAYVLGHSAKVPKELVALANAANFPMEVGVTAAEDLTITDKFIITGSGPQQLVAGTITIVKPNGQIVARGVDLSIKAQHMVVTEG